MDRAQEQEPAGRHEQQTTDDGGQQTMNGGLRVNKWQDGWMQVTTGGSSSRGEQQCHPRLQPQM